MATRPEYLKHIVVDIRFVTPEMAKEWLANTKRNNRSLRKGVVEKYVYDIKNNAWTVNSSAIGFDTDGNLTNGQHRLNAIVKADRGIYTLCIFGLPIRSMDTEDVGASRGVNGALQIRGVENANAKKAIVQVIANHVFKTTVVLSVSQYDNFNLRFPGAIDWVWDAFKGAKVQIRAGVRAAFLYAWISGEHRELIESIVSDLKNSFAGTFALAGGSTEVALRSYILDGSLRDDGDVIFRKVTRAIHSIFVGGKPLTKLQESKEGIEYFEKILEAYEKAGKF